MALTDDGKITITITDDRGSGGGGSVRTGSGASKRAANFNNIFDTPIKEADKEFLDFAKHEAIHFFKAESMKIINNYIGTIGARTGNYVTQQNAQSAMSVCLQGYGIMMAAKTGFKLSGGNPYGAAIGAGIGIIFAGTNRIMEYKNQERQVRIQNRDIAMLRQRAGLDVNSNGSR